MSAHPKQIASSAGYGKQQVYAYLQTFHARRVNSDKITTF